jgi:hypothetical protein
MVYNLQFQTFLHFLTIQTIENLGIQFWMYKKSNLSTVFPNYLKNCSRVLKENLHTKNNFILHDWILSKQKWRGVCSKVSCDSCWCWNVENISLLRMEWIASAEPYEWSRSQTCVFLIKARASRDARKTAMGTGIYLCHKMRSANRVDRAAALVALTAAFFLHTTARLIF